LEKRTGLYSIIFFVNTEIYTIHTKKMTIGTMVKKLFG